MWLPALNNSKKKKMKKNILSLLWAILLFMANQLAAATLNGGNYGGADLTPANGDVLNGSFTNVGIFHVRPGVTVYINPGTAFSIAATCVIIEGTINGNGAGYTGGAVASAGSAGNNGNGPGGGIGGFHGGCVHGTGGGGGGYGNSGGNGSEHNIWSAGTSGGQGGSSYGSSGLGTLYMGSGGAAGASHCSSSSYGIAGAGGNGGASIEIISLNRILVSGNIYANGNNGGNGQDITSGYGGAGGGGGSGGSIKIVALSGFITGTVTANGGKGGNAGLGGPYAQAGGGGSGGRIGMPSTLCTDGSTITAAGGLYGSNAQNSVTAPSSGGTGTVLGGTVCGTTPLTAQNVCTKPASLDFDGSNDYVVVPHNSVQVGMSALTLEAWVYITGSTGVYRNVLVKGDYGYGMIIDDNNELGYWSDPNYSNCPHYGHVPFDTWTHVAVVVEKGVSTKFYINGKNVGTTTNSGHTTINNGSNDSLIIGSQGTGCRCNYFDGKMDEVRIWNIARTSNDILGSMNCELPATSGLIARYYFDEGDPQSANSGLDTLSDRSGNWMVGKLKNFALTGTNSNWDYPATGQEISVSGLSNTITDGDATPSLSDGTLFAPEVLSRTFAIKNTLHSTLRIDSVKITGTHATDFEIQSISNSILGAGVSANLVIKFYPSAVGTRNATINIYSNDCDEGVFDFAVSGVGEKADALELDGTNDYLVSGSNTGLSGSSARSLEFWAKLDDKNQFAHLANWGNGSGNGKSFGLYTNSGSLYFHGWGSADFNTGYSTDTNWHHYAVTYNGSVVNVYVDGNATPTTGVSVSLNTTNGLLYLGVREDLNMSTTLDGSLDHLRVWSTARSQTEISSNLNCELKSGSGLVFNYYFNQGVYKGLNTSINTAIDSSSNANHASLNNFTLKGAGSNWTKSNKLGQKIAVYGNTVLIAAGDTIPSVADFTDMNRKSTQEFAIYNSGTSNLVISSITKSGKNPSNFSISAVTPSSTIAPNSYGYITVSYYALNDSLKTADINIHNNSCEYGTYTFRLSNRKSIASGLDFDGNDDVVFTPVKILSGSSYTKEAWIKIHNQNNWNNQIAGGNYNTLGGNTTFSTYYGHLAAGHPNMSSWTNVYDNDPLPLDSWIHAAVTFDAKTNTMILYKNGQVVSTSTVSPTNSDDEISIGGMGYNYFMYGKMDEVRIWNYARKACEIAENYQCEIHGSLTGLLANYHFNQGFDSTNNSGLDTLVDSSGNANNGRLYNFTLNGATSNWIANTAVKNGNSCISNHFFALKGKGINILKGSKTLLPTNNTQYKNLTIGEDETHTFKLFNTGADSLTINNMACKGVDSSMFTLQTFTYPIKLAIGDSMSFTVKFAPTQLSEHSVNVLIQSNSCALEDFTFSIGGTVLLKKPTFTLSPNPYCGGNITITASSDSADKILYYSDSTNGTLLGTANNGAGIVFTPTSGTNYYYAQAQKIVSKSIQYNIAFSDLKYLYYGCGGINDHYSNYSAPIGFGWTDNSTGKITDVSVEFAMGVDCWGGSRNAYLNSVYQTTFYTNYNCTCSPSESVNGITQLNLNVNDYIKGGANEFTMVNEYIGFMQHSGLNYNYARVTVKIEDTINSISRTKITVVKDSAEISVLGKSVNIADGSSTVSLSDSTKFGNVIAGTKRRFKIKNTGLDSLKISSIVLGGSNASEFSLSNEPTAIKAGDSAYFTVTFIGSTTGTKTATITINNNDCNESIFDFAIEAGLTGDALAFDGNSDNVRIPHNSTFNPSTALTLEAWVYRTASQYSTVIAKWDDDNNNRGYMMNFGELGNNDKLCFVATNTGSWLPSPKIQWQTNTALNLNQWYHVAITFTQSGNNNLKYYLNGVLTDQTTWNFSINPSNPIDILIGGYDGPGNGQNAGANSRYFAGKLDEIRVWNYSRTCSEIASTMNHELVGNESGLIGYYNFNQGIANGNNSGADTLYDRSANGFKGKLNSFALSGSSSNWVQPGSGVTGTTPDGKPEINVQGNGISVLDEDVTPATADSTDFGRVSSGTKRRFTIQNTGAATLSISSIALSGTHASNYSISGAPSSVSAGSSASFYVTFNTTTSGVKTAIITINNNDCDEAAYNFNIQAEINCTLGNPVATSVTTHVSTVASTDASGWTCYCNASNELLLALKLGGTGASIPAAGGVELKINSTSAVWYPHSTGFIGNNSGWAGLNKTWEVYPTTQPSSPVPVRFFVSTADINAVNSTLSANSLNPISSVSEMSFYKVVNSTKPAHSAVSNLSQADVKIYCNTSSANGEIPFTDSAYGGGKFHAQFNVNSFSGGGGGSGGAGLTPLPVSLLKFTGKREGTNGSVLNWTAVSDANDLQQFDVQRSTDNNTFIQIGTVMPNGDGVYNFHDVNLKSGVIYYYRLKIRLTNGTYSYSNLVAVSIDAKSNTQINVYPVPAANTLFIDYNAECSGNCNYRIVETSGRVAATGELVQGTNKIGTANLAEGIYILQIVNGEQMRNFKVMIKH